MNNTKHKKWKKRVKEIFLMLLIAVSFAVGVFYFTLKKQGIHLPWIIFPLSIVVFINARSALKEMDSRNNHIDSTTKNTLPKEKISLAEKIRKLFRKMSLFGRNISIPKRKYLIVGLVLFMVFLVGHYIQVKRKDDLFCLKQIRYINSSYRIYFHGEKILFKTKEDAEEYCHKIMTPYREEMEQRPVLDPSYRKKLLHIVAQMEEDGYDDRSIQDFVDAFVQKYGHKR